MGSRHYSTDKLDHQRKLKAWREYMSTVYYDLDVRANNEAIHGELTERDYGSISVTEFRSSSQEFFRSAAAAKLDASESYVLFFPTRRSMGFKQRGFSGVVVPGSTAVLNSAESYTAIVPDNTAITTLKVPCELLRSRVKGFDEVCAKSSFANPSLVNIVGDLGRKLLEFEPGEVADRLQDVMINLICIMTEAKSDENVLRSLDSSVVTVIFKQACIYIRKNFADPDLSPAKAATALNMSERYLHRLFRKNNVTFSELVMETRLLAACEMLSAASLSSQKLSIGEVAYRCGFVSQAHFSVRFRERFRVTPRMFQFENIC